MCHMKTITIRELHHNTGEWLRKAAKFGEIHVTERGKTIAKILPQALDTRSALFRPAEAKPTVSQNNASASWRYRQYSNHFRRSRPAH